MILLISEVKLLAGRLVKQWLKFIKSGQAIFDVALAAAFVGPANKSTVATSSPTSTVVNVPPSLSHPSPAEEGKKVITPSRKTPKPVPRYPSSEEEEEEVPPIGSLPLYKITVRDGKSVLAKVGTKTLAVSIPKRSENDGESSAVTSVIMKSDPSSKKIRYVTKSDKSDGSDSFVDDNASRDKNDEMKSIESKLSDSTNVTTHKLEGKSDDGDHSKQKTVDKSKSVSSKSSVKDIKSKDSHSNKSSKSHRDRDRDKGDSRHKEKEKRDSRDSDRDKKRSDHKSHKSDKDRDRDKDRDKDKSKSKDSSRDKGKDYDKIKSREKDSKSKDPKSTEKSLSAAEKAQIQADKDKDTLERLKTPAISLLGKIPKKPQNANTSLTTGASSPSPANKQTEEAKKLEIKRPEARGPKERPKTVKTFNSKFRSTGLEEGIKPPPPRGVIKKKTEEKKPAVKPEISLKHPSSSPKDGSPPEKKSKVAEIIEAKKDKILDKPGGIKLIPPKPKRKLSVLINNSFHCNFYFIFWFRLRWKIWL